MYIKKLIQHNYYRVVLVLICIIDCSGCLNFGENKETLKPSIQQVQHCRSVMYLNPSSNIIPLGYKFEGAGIDDAIWFKFKTNSKSISEIFDEKKVDTTKFKKGYKLQEIKEIKWWDVAGKNFFGGQVELPQVKYMEVGIQKEIKGFIVYIMWFET